MEAIGWWTALLRTVALAAWTLVASCAHYTSSLSPADKPSPTRGYVYGRFHLDAQRLSPRLLGGYQAMGFVIRCSDGHEYTIRFLDENRVQVIAVRPAQCALAEAVFTQDGIVEARKPAVGSSQGGFALAAGTAYYLGDYDAESTIKATHMGAFSLVESTWDLLSVDDKYDDTSAEMKRTFANLAGLSTESRMLVPPRRIPGTARKHTGGARRGPDDVVSPERAARLADFTKRRYATPAACEAACPETGDCYPFRGEDGPAMTCVVRCKTDKDCPEGLACNCPDGDGSACRPIAGTSDDAMAEICLSAAAWSPPPPTLRLTPP